MTTRKGKTKPTRQPARKAKGDPKPTAEIEAKAAARAESAALRRKLAQERIARHREEMAAERAAERGEDAPKHVATPGKWGDWRDVFLRELSQHTSIRRACEAAGIHRSTAYEARSVKNAQTGEDKGEVAAASARAFAAAWDEAIEDARDRLEEEAWRRAVEGVQRERYDKDGFPTSIETEYSDTLLLKLLAANNKPKFGDRGTVSGQVNVDVSQLSTEQLERLAAGEDVLTVIAGARAG